MHVHTVAYHGGQATVGTTLKTKVHQDKEELGTAGGDGPYSLSQTIGV